MVGMTSVWVWHHLPLIDMIFSTNSTGNGLLIMDQLDIDPVQRSAGTFLASLAILETLWVSRRQRLTLASRLRIPRALSGMEDQYGLVSFRN